LLLISLLAQPAGAASGPRNGEILGGYAGQLFSARTGTGPGWADLGAPGDEPQLSPDGRFVAIRAYATDSQGQTGCCEVFIRHLDGTGLRQVTFRGKFPDGSIGEFAPSWAPDSRHLVISYDGALWVIDTQSRATRQLTKPVGLEDADPRWSPDGKTIAFTRRTPDWIHSTIDTVPAAGGKVHQLTPRTPGWDDYPDWSPDSTRIVYVRTRDYPVANNGTLQISQIRMLSRDGADLPALTPKRTAAYFAYPVFSPDGKRIAVLQLMSQPDPWGQNDYSIAQYDTHGAFKGWVPGALRPEMDGESWSGIDWIPQSG
jgi:Tol biopolymer transport system component